MAEQLLRTKIKPAFNGGVLDAVFLNGGLKIVATKDLRNSIGYNYRFFSPFVTTLCFITGENNLYKLINNPTTDYTQDSDWELVQINSITSFSPIGTWNPNTNTPTLSDADAAGKNGDFYFVSDTPNPIDVTISGMFGDETTNVANGRMVISVGTRWIVVSNSTTWDALDKPQSIVDYYLSGIVIPHTHSAEDITGLGDLDFLTRDDTADHTIDFNSVPNDAIIELEFLKTHYMRATTIESTYLKKIGDSGVLSFTFANNGGIDVDASVGTDVLNIGTNNADVINIGRAGGVVNIYGTTNYENQINLAIENKLIRLNVNGAVASGTNSGFEIEEDALITGYFMTNSSRDGYLMKAPGSYEAEFDISGLTADRSYLFPDVSGTLALISQVLSTSLDQAKINIGDNTNVAVARLLSGDVTMDYLGAVTIANDAITTAKILNSAVSYAKIQDISVTDRLLGRDTAGAGTIEEISVGGGLEFSGAGSLQTSAFTGDVTKAAGATALAIANDAVSYAKMQNVSATNRFLGRITAGAGDPEELTGTQATTLLDLFATTATTKGLVPGSNNAGAGYFLQADGSWAIPAGAGHAIYNGEDVAALTTRSNLRINNGLTASDNNPDTLAQLGGELIQDTLLNGEQYLAINTKNFGLFSDTPDFEEGNRIMFIGVCTTPPTTPPASGVFVYVQQINSTYELRIMDSSGNIKGVS